MQILSALHRYSPSYHRASMAAAAAGILTMSAGTGLRLYDHRQAQSIQESRYELAQTRNWTRGDQISALGVLCLFGGCAAASYFQRLGGGENERN